MLRILLDLRPFSGFLKHSVRCALCVCPHRKSVFVLYCSSMLNSRNASVSLKTGVFIPWISFSYCESEPSLSQITPFKTHRFP
jgi:hypothetical protein